MRVKAYIINLKSSPHRKDYMVKQMAPLSCFETAFVEAVDGRTMTVDEQEILVDQSTAIKHYGRKLRPTEIGCLLSHKKCAQKLLDSDASFSLVLEDDLIWQTYEVEELLKQLENVLVSEHPRIILLSGDYWYWELKPFFAEYRLATIWDAVCAQAYLINRAAAKKLLEIPNWHLADDWFEIRKTGIDVKALYPHIADQNRHDIKSDIAAFYGGIDRKRMSKYSMVRSIFRSFVDKLLVWTNHFESKKFKW